MDWSAIIQKGIDTWGLSFLMLAVLCFYVIWRENKGEKRQASWESYVEECHTHLRESQNAHLETAKSVTAVAQASTSALAAWSATAATQERQMVENNRMFMQVLNELKEGIAGGTTKLEQYAQRAVHEREVIKDKIEEVDDKVETVESLVRGRK